jgi:protein-tyrosine-phosphatase
MEKVHEERLVQMAPEAKNRIFLLKELGGITEGGLDVEDPIGKSMDFYVATLAVIREAVEKVSGII